jgi:hypothetical protein
MIIKTKLSEKEFIDASLAIIWSRRYSKLLLLVLLFIVTINLFNSTSTKDSLISLVLPPILIFGGLFIVFRYSFKRAYQKNYKAGENIEYNFTDSHLLITGESFNSEVTWNKIYKVTKTKKWLLVWHISQIANAIPLRLLSSEDLTQLKDILQKNNTKNNL